MKTKSNHGGKRKGAGAKLKYGEETKTISFRVPLALAEKITTGVKKTLKEYLERK